MKKASLLISFALLLFMAILSGCSGTKKESVAKVGDDYISTDYFNEYFARKVRYKFPSSEEEYNKRRQMLDTLVITQLFIQGAYEKGLDKSDELNRVILTNRNNFLLDILFNKKIRSKIDPTDVELKEFWDHLEYKVRAAHILLNNEDTAKMVLQKIKDGGNFEQLALEYSTDPSVERNKGDLGFFGWGDMVDEFGQAAYSMNVGEISPPVKSRFGYHIIKLLDKQPNENRRPFDQMKADLKNRLGAIETSRLSQKYFEEIKKKYPINIEQSTCEYILHKREQIYPPMLLETLPKNDFDQEQLDRDEKQLVLATYDGGEITINEYLSDIQKIPPRYKADFDDYDSLAAIIFELKKMDILAMEAVREGIDQDPEYLDRVRLFKELNMADVLMNDSLGFPPAPSEEEIRKYYDDHPEEFNNPAQVHVFEILLSDEIKARKLVKSIKSMVEFKKKASELTERGGMKVKNGDLGYIQRAVYPDIFDLAYKTPIGEIAGPVVVGGKYSIFYVVDKIEPQLKDFLGQKRYIVERMIANQKDSVTMEWLDERMKNTDIEIFDDVLMSTIDMDKYPNEKKE